MIHAGPSPLVCGAPLDAAQAVCVFLHGRGQTPEEMIADTIARLARSDIAYVLPRAPGKSWYAARAIDRLTPGTEAELGASMAAVAKAVAATRSDRPLLLAGFSQGACLALELTLRGQMSPDALVVFTGCRVGTPACHRPVRPLQGLATYISGSDADPWIPPAAFADAAGTLADQGAGLRAESFPGRSHSVSDDEIAVLDAMLATLAARPRP
jgi:phospholipase/carboxylesterase